MPGRSRHQVRDHLRHCKGAQTRTSGAKGLGPYRLFGCLETTAGRCHGPHERAPLVSPVRLTGGEDAAACVVRLAHRLGGRLLGILHLLYADDGWAVATGQNFWAKLLYWMFVLDLLEVPISWHKVGGGASVAWIGLPAGSPPL